MNQSFLPSTFVPVKTMFWLFLSIFAACAVEPRKTMKSPTTFLATNAMPKGLRAYWEPLLSVKIKVSSDQSLSASKWLSYIAIRTNMPMDVDAIDGDPKPLLIPKGEYDTRQLLMEVAKRRSLTMQFSPDLFRLEIKRRQTKEDHP